MITPSRDTVLDLLSERVPYDAVRDTIQEIFSIMLDLNPDEDPDFLFDAAGDLLYEHFPYRE